MPRATGSFDVTLSPLPTDGSQLIEGIGRMAIDKQYHGELEATGQGQMLTAGTAIKNSAGYVAVERVTGVLKGRKGSFMLQHNGIMNRGQPSLVITVIPDSGTDQLDGIRGTMSIRIEGGKHYYDLTYTLGAT
jgi:hypothetical protein